MSKGRLAQLVEHLVYTERVGGSSPSSPTNKFMRLNQKRVLITGAGSGIGKACSLLFYDHGADLVLTDLNEDLLSDSNNKIISKNNVQIISGDVSKKNNAKSIVDFSVKKLGGLDILINCAGVNPRGAPKNYDFEQIWDWVININLKGTYLMSYFASNEMKKDGGSIVNLASINGFVGYNQGIDSNLKGINPYPHSKGGVIQLTKDMAVGLAKQNIRVNALCPGYSKTNLTRMLWEDKKVEKYITSLHPMGRLADPKEIAFAALFLASDEASFITGACLPVDGGYLAQ